MATNFPAALDTTTQLPNAAVTGGIIPASVDNNASDAIIAVETKLGSGASTAATGQFLVGSAAGVTGYRVIAAADVPTLNQSTTGNAATATTATSATTATTASVANALKSATTTVDVSAATAPTIGQVLTATSGTAATWQTAGAGGGQTLVTKVVAASGGDYTTLDAACSAANTAGGSWHIHVRAGTYASSGITVTTPNVMITGDGRATIIQGTNMAHNVNGAGFVLKDITFKDIGMGGAFPGWGGTEYLLENVFFSTQNGTSQAQFGGAQGKIGSGSGAVSSIQLTGTDIIFTGNTIIIDFKSFGPGLLYMTGDNYVVTGNTFRLPAGQGAGGTPVIYAGASHGLITSNAVFDGSGGFGIDVGTGFSGVIVSNNKLRGTVTFAVRTSTTSTTCAVIGNVAAGQTFTNGGGTGTVFANNVT
jgi:hypothetical protein